MASGARSLVSYDDITVPYHTNPSLPQSHKPPPAKKRKWNKNKGRNHNTALSTTNSFRQGHVDNIDQTSSVAVDEDVEPEDEGRDLSHEEIWDDSALIDAWNAATEEYEAYNGPEKGWKKEPVHHSPLWYNIPKNAEKIGQTDPNGNIFPVREQENSRPLNFDTFTPSHDPSLSTRLPDGVPSFLSGAPGPIVSQDEAFTHAMGAMYWSGYWTAMYHLQRRQSAQEEIQQGEEDSFDEGESSGDGEDDDNEAFVSTQR